MQSGCKRIAMMIVYCNFYDCFAHKHAKAAMMIAAREALNAQPDSELPPTRLPRGLATAPSCNFVSQHFAL